MKGFVVSKAGDSHGSLRDDLPIPTPLPEEALVRVLRAGVCNTDLEILQGYMGFTGILGHEFVGVVTEVNSETPELKERWMGKRVCGDINVGCASCWVCANAPHDRNCAGGCPQMSRNHCPYRTVLGILNKHGTMAEFLTLPLHNLHEVPDHVSDEVAVFAEPLAAACRIVEQNLVRYKEDLGRVPPDKVAILGDGKLGLMIAEVLGREHTLRLGKNKNNDNDNDNNSNSNSNSNSISNSISNSNDTINEDDSPRPVLFGKHSHKLDLVRETAGVDCKPVVDCIDASRFSGVAAEHEHRYDVVVDATGSPAGLKLAAGMCRPMGTLVLKSTCAAGTDGFNAAPLVIDELRVVGSRCGPIDRALELLAIPNHGIGESVGDESSNNSCTIEPLNVEKYITKTFPLSEVEAAIRCAAERSTMKVQIVCSTGHE